MVEKPKYGKELGGQQSNEVKLTEQENKPLAPSPNPREYSFVSRIKEGRVRRATGLMDAQTEYANAFEGYQRACERANDIDTILQKDQIERDIDLLDALDRKANLERKHSLTEAEDQKQISDYNANIAEAKLREKQANDQLIPPKEKTPEEHRTELDRKREINKHNSEDWALRSTQRATSKFDTINKLDKACKLKLEEMVKVAVKEGWDGETIDVERRHIMAFFENEKNRID